MISLLIVYLFNIYLINELGFEGHLVDYLIR